MEVTIKVLEAMFRGMSPSRLLEMAEDPGKLLASKSHWKLLTQYCSGYLMGYSLNEQELILKQICGRAAVRAGLIKSAAALNTDNIFLPRAALYTVLDLAQSLLVIRGGEHLCRTEHLMAWRDASLPLGQDLFTCAFLAWEDLKAGRERKSFSWPAVLRADHSGINGILARGLAENHQHLYGSSQTFSLSWCSLMNYTDSHDVAVKMFRELFSPFTAVSSADRLLPTREKVQLACAYRAFLFRWVKTVLENVPEDVRNERVGRLCHSLLHTPRETYIAHELPLLRSVYGAAVPLPGGRSECLDYALEPGVLRAGPGAAFRALGGERSLLYNCMRLFFTDRMDPRTQMIFYIYLILKNMFRGEMIQINQKVGFQNFSKYQDRKDDLCRRPCYEAELIRMAVNAPIAEGSVSSLETRLTPKLTEHDYADKVDGIDRLYDFAAGRADRPPTPEERRYFFVFHFIKSPDGEPGRGPILSAPCRHSRLRGQVKDQAKALARALSRRPGFCRRVRGIDAASNEVVCPPEVFAQCFRFLRSFRPRDFSGTWDPERSPLPRLSATYHVGEDFLDIAGALRAVDETVEFLGLSRGDRLGHALGLGVEPKLHYSLKGSRIFQGRQERLDNLVWVTHRARDFGVVIDPHLYGRLKKEAEILLLRLYGGYADNVSLTEYYCSMQLRGDDPGLYSTGRYVSRKGLVEPYDRAGILEKDYLEQYRNHDPTAWLYHLYHFSRQVKLTGAEPVEILIDEPYMRLMRDIQDAMQGHVRDLGIGIECNPSSNVLIGTFRSYEEHPVFRFNNAMIEQDPQRRASCSQLQVCINTDDLGVFDTSQEFEYALLFQALSQTRRGDGSRAYLEVDILSYLESLRRMGHEATFPAAQHINREVGF